MDTKKEGLRPDWYLYNILMNDCLHDHPEYSHRTIFRQFGLSFRCDLKGFYFILTGFKKNMYYPLFGLVSESYMKIYYAIEQRLTKRLDPYVQGFDMFQIYENDMKQIAILFTPSENRSETALQVAQLVQDTVRQVYEEALSIQKTPYRNVTALSGPCRNFSGIREGFLEAKALSELSFFQASLPVFTRETIANARKKADYQSILKQCYEIDRFLGTGETDAALRGLKELFLKDLKHNMCFSACQDALSFLKFSIHMRKIVYGLEDGEEPDQVFQAASYYRIEECYEALKNILEPLCRVIHSAGHYQMPVQLALFFIRSHCREDISLGDIAAYADVNPNYLSGIFNKEVGCSVRDEITRARMKIAQRELRESDRKIHEIAKELCIRDVRKFTKAFKKLTGMTPREYRREAGDSLGR